MIESLQKESWDLQFQRAKTCFAEVDLIFQRSREVRLIEVKTLDNPWRSFQRISTRQVQRLILNQIHFSQAIPQFHYSCEVAWVSNFEIEYTHIN